MPLPNPPAPPASPAFLESPLDASSAEPLQRQLYQRLKEAILQGQLAAASKLPASRALAQTLAISRNTVAIAYERLMTEGYIHADRQGTTVTALLRSNLRSDLQAGERPEPTSTVPSSPAAPFAGPIAARLSHFPLMPSGGDMSAALRPGVPAIAHFPLTLWRKALDRVVRDSPPSMLNYGDPAGRLELRTAIARHVAITRGVHCQPQQVIITEGAQEALSLCVRLLTNPGDTAWVEDPGYRGAKAAFHAGDLHIVPQRMDAQGLCIADEAWRASPPKLVYLTPSHQYPTGAVMSVARRLALIAQAQQHGSWLIEDDYDSEFRHSGEPIAALQGLVPGAPVLYVGTFSKTMFPSLRLGFVVLPQSLLTVVDASLRDMLRGGNSHVQGAMADFMASGQFVRHLGRMRRLYRERQLALRQALTQHLHVPHAMEGGPCGLHLTVRFSADYPDTGIAQAAHQHGMAPQALSTFALAPKPQDNGLVLGYGNTASTLFEPLVKRLNGLMQAVKYAGHHAR